MKPILMIGISLLLTSRISAQEQKTAPGCDAVALTISLKAGESFERRINGLTFKVRAEQQKERGWMFSLEDDAGHDLIYPVNPPIRFNPSQMLGPGYSLTARKSLEWNRELRFLLTQSDYERIDPLLEDALWPYYAPNPDRAGEDYLKALVELRTGLLRLKILRSDVDANDHVRSAKLRVEFVAPSGFRFDPLVKPRPAACPPQPAPL